VSPFFCGALKCIQTLRGGQTPRRPITKGLAINWQEVVSFGFWLAMVLQSTRDVTHLALVFHSLNFLIYIGQRFRQKNFKYQFIAKPGRYRPPLKTNALAGLQLLGRFRRRDFARQVTTLLARWWDKLCRAVYYIFGPLVGKKLWGNFFHLFHRSTGFVNSALTLPARLLRLV